MCCQLCRYMIHWFAGFGYRHDYARQDKQHLAKVIRSQFGSTSSNRFESPVKLGRWSQGTNGQC